MHSGWGLLNPQVPASRPDGRFIANGCDSGLRHQLDGRVEISLALWRSTLRHQAPPCTHLDEPMGRRRHYHVYVIELSKDVLYEGRFIRANPNYVMGRPCVYVGMTGLNPDVRFDKHKAGIQSNRYVVKFGLRLLPALYEVYNPMPYDGARDMEVELAIDLRE